jgi:hypothetical protein
MSMDDTDIAAIARGLSPLIAKAIKGCREYDDGWYFKTGTARGTIPLGLATRTIDGNRLTPLGLAVRAHLETDHG